MKHGNIKRLTAAITMAIASTTVIGQDISLEEIVVTAERRETTLQSTPAAIVALTGDSIESSNINNMNELTLTTPGINISGINRNQQYIAMRGKCHRGRRCRPGTVYWILY